MSRRKSWTAGFVLAAAALPLLVGCGGDSVKTYPLKGKIVFKGKGGNLRQLVGGHVRLQSVSDASLMPVGEIEDDGTFSIGTIVKEKGLAGAPAGQYKARIELRPLDDEEESRRRVIPAKYEDFDKSGLTVTVPASGDFVIELIPLGR